MEIIILSKEKVKPSTPTPPHLRNHKLCLIDQLVPGNCITPIFFYKNNIDNRLKKSLSETLTLFYPLAGELNSEDDSTFVKCNDNGVLYVEACVKDSVCLDEFIRNLDLSQLINFLPQHASMGSKMNYVQTLETLVSIKVTRFHCGGVAIGGVLFHRLLDGYSMSKFFNAWAKITRGDHNDDIASPDFTSSSLLFPPQNLPQEFIETNKMIFFHEEKSLVRRFVFNAKAIEAIKMKVSSENVPNPSRVEALTTFIWKHLILATRTTKGVSLSTPIMVAHIVNLRSRIEPKLLNAFGNLVFIATSEVIEMSNDDELELPHLLGIVREMLENMNSENLKALEVNGIVDMVTQVGSLLTQLDTYKFSSWCNFGLYDVDFGWGKPIFIAPFIEPISSLNKQQIILVENGRNDGIEAWILRNNEEMIELEKDEEFLTYASPNPSII
ncbi:hypothetical protein EJD97_018538 [Solanum chilense]|uniref:Uncharacterized protein n=1 Tax=Solanum chilense TaxID=4083 RepID=A0A6N2B343_SOLCI|nr:hypothetical protein EJD97_018538 [Solanum chilense]